jgi:DNA-binding NarL/FixJ family response regulator
MKAVITGVLCSPTNIEKVNVLDSHAESACASCELLGRIEQEGMNNLIRPIRVLVVDDFGPWRGSISRIVQGRPNTTIVGEAADGLEAVRKAEELQPDLILLDIGLPGMNGLDASRAIKRLLPDCHIIFVSQNVDKDVIDIAMSDGAKGYVVKTEARNELLNAITAVLNGERFVSARLSAG